MTLTTSPRKPAVAARRTGYVIGVLVNAAMLYLVNVWPGWDVAPFLTADTELVLGLVNASIIVNLAANVVYVVSDPVWLKGLGSLVTTTVGLLAMVRLWQVYPFDFGDGSFDWGIVVSILLGVGIFGSVVAIVVAFTTFVKGVAGRTR